MPAKLKTTLATAGVGAIAAAAILGGATPAFAKSSETINGPRVVRAGQAFRLTVQVGDDGGARPASARLQVRGPRGGYRWSGIAQKLRLTGAQPPDWEQCSFTVAENHPGTYTFRAVFTGNQYLPAGPITVTVR
jgi:hypothetical protein